MLCLKAVCAVPVPRTLPGGNGTVQPRAQKQKWRIMSSFFMLVKIIFGCNIHLVQCIVNLVQIEQSTACKALQEIGYGARKTELWDINSQLRESQSCEI